jgi:predicted sugar kinase
MTELGAAGVGQSSWGPTVYSIVEGEHRAAQLADEVRAILSTLGVTGNVYEGPFRTDGARVWHETPGGQ